ncbi:hypothetical protein [Aquimarina rhabdastrellae]
MEKAIGILIPIENDYVESPNIIYSDDLDSICFPTEDEKYGRITFEKLDSLRVSRGEYIPYEWDWKEDEPYYWVYKIENSNWLKERYTYEKKHYGDCYGFGGDVNEMLTDFSHYLFKFHDEFIEVISRGFWFEKDEKPLINQPILNSHPNLKINSSNSEILKIKRVNCKIVRNELPLENIEVNSKFHRQRLFEFYKEDAKNEFSEIFTVYIFQRNQETHSCISGFFGKEIFVKKGIITMEEIRPFLKNEIK